MNLTSFIISSIIIVILPGTGVIYTISKGLTSGKRASMIAALGCTLGIIPHLCLSVVLSSLLLQKISGVFQIIQILGALYLAYLGIDMIRSKAQILIPSEQNCSHSISIIRQAILINLLNPKLTIFFFSFLPQYVTVNSDHALQKSILLGIIFMFMTLIVFLCYGILASQFQLYFEKSPKKVRGLQICFGLIFLFFAVKMLITIL